MAESFMSNAMLVASIRGIFSDARRLRERFVSIAAQVETDLDTRLADEPSVCQLYAAMATVREIARSGEQRIARAHSSLFRAATPSLRREFQAAYEEGAKGAKFAEDRPPLVNGRPSCCEAAATQLTPHIHRVYGHWIINTINVIVENDGNSRTVTGYVKVDHCPFCGTRLPAFVNWGSGAAAR